MKYQYHDGGRAAAGFKGGASDCVSRALAITTGSSYEHMRDCLLHRFPNFEKEGVDVSSVDFINFMGLRGFSWVPALNGYHRLSDLPAASILVVAQKGHYTAIVDGCVFDTFDTRPNTFTGYWLSAVDSNLAARFDVVKVSAKGQRKLNRSSLNLAQALTMRSLYHLNYGGNIQLVKWTE